MKQIGLQKMLLHATLCFMFIWLKPCFSQTSGCKDSTSSHFPLEKAIRIESHTEEFQIKIEEVSKKPSYSITLTSESNGTEISIAKDEVKMSQSLHCICLDSDEVISVTLEQKNDALSSPLKNESLTLIIKQDNAVETIPLSSVRLNGKEFAYVTNKGKGYLNVTFCPKDRNISVSDITKITPNSTCQPCKARPIKNKNGNEDSAVTDRTSVEGQSSFFCDGEQCNALITFLIALLALCCIAVLGLSAAVGKLRTRKGGKEGCKKKKKRQVHFSASTTNGSKPGPPPHPPPTLPTSSQDQYYTETCQGDQPSGYQTACYDEQVDDGSDFPPPPPTDPEGPPPPAFPSCSPAARGPPPPPPQELKYACDAATAEYGPETEAIYENCDQY